MTSLQNRVLLDVSGVSAKDARLGKTLRTLALRFMSALELEGAELSLTLVDDDTIRKLNHEWRGKNKATDVLSFPIDDEGMLGDVVISVETAKRAAPEFDSTYEQELERYLAHGLLHLLGFDHVKPADARKMRAREAKLLGYGGMLHRSPEVRRARRLK